MNTWYILIVEDHPDGREIMTQYLEFLNIRSDAVALAEEAVELLQEKTYTALISDYHLPGMDGMKLVEWVRENPKTALLPCVMITADHSAEVRQRALEAGFDACFTKPMDKTAFIRELDHIISGAVS